MFKVIKTEQSLKKPPRKAEAYLSDLFFILYFIYLHQKKNKKLDKINLQKGIVYILEELQKQGKIDEIKIFNLAFYPWLHGDYNKIISENYIPKLLRGSLIEEEGVYYRTTGRAKKLLEMYENENVDNQNLKTINEIFDNYPEGLRGSFRKARQYSHGRKVLVNDKVKLIDDLVLREEEDFSKNEHTATAYNSSPKKIKELEDGFKSNIVNTNYLLALNSLLEEINFEQEESKNSIKKYDKIIKGIFSKVGVKN